MQQLVACLGADFQCVAHLLNVHHIGILAQHHTVGIALVKSFAAYTKHLFFENLRIAMVIFFLVNNLLLSAVEDSAQS